MSVFNIVHGYPNDLSKLGLITYAICDNGVFLIRKAGNGFIITKEDGVKGFGSGPKDDIVNTILTRKIPIDAYNKAVTFFRNVMDTFKKDALEAFILVLYNKDTDHYKLYVPMHKVSAGTVNYDIQDVWKQNPGYKIVLDIHSHHDMGAFFSGTDDKDDNRDRYSAVIGKISKIFPDFKVRFNTLGKHAEFELEDIFEQKSNDKLDLDITDSLTRVALIKRQSVESWNEEWNGRSYKHRNSTEYIPGVTVPRSGYAGIFNGFRRHTQLFGKNLKDIDDAIGDI